MGEIPSNRRGSSGPQPQSKSKGTPSYQPPQSSYGGGSQSPQFGAEEIVILISAAIGLVLLVYGLWQAVLAW